MAKKKTSAAGTPAKDVVPTQAAAPKPQVNLTVDLWPGHDNRGLYISCMQADVPIPWGHTAVVIVVDGDTGEVVDATLAVRQTDQRDVRVVDARVVNAFNQCLHAVTGAVEVTVTVRVDAKTLMSLAEVYQEHKFTKQLEDLRKTINGIMFGDAGQPADLNAMAPVADDVVIVEEMTADGAAVETDDDTTPFDEAPILSYIEAKDAAVAEAAPEETLKKTRGRKPKAATVVEEVAFEEASEEPVEEEPVEEEPDATEEEDAEADPGYDPETQFVLADGEVVDKSEFTSEEIDNGDGTAAIVYTRGDKAYMLEMLDDEQGVEWLVEVQFGDDEEEAAEDDDAAEEEQVDDDEGYETVVGDDEEEEVSEEEVTLDEKQQVLYDEFMDKIKDYDVQNLYAIAHRNGIKGAELDAEFKRKNKPGMLVTISNMFLDVLLNGPSK